MSIELLTITGYTNGTFKTAVAGSSYQLMINPDELHWNRNIGQSQNGQTVAATGENSGNPSRVNLTFDTVIDCTGIVDAQRVDLPQEIQNLESQLYTVKKGVYSPNYIKITWGSKVLFYSQLRTCNISYTLFKPDGTPLRAKISFVFAAHENAQPPVKKKGWLDFL